MDQSKYLNSKSQEIALLLTVACVGMIAFMQVYSIQSILPILQEDLSINAVTAGSLVGATVLAISLISPFMGMISDALGRRVFIIGAIFLLSVPTFMISYAETEQQIWLCRFFQGLCIPSITVVLIAFVGEEFSGTLRLKLMSFYVSGTVLGGFLGRFLVGNMTSWIGWQKAYVVMAAISFLSALVVIKYLPKSENFVAKPNVKQAFIQLLAHIHNPHIIAACLLGFCVMYSLVGSFTYINLHFAEAPYYFSASDLANVFAVYLVGMLVTPISAKMISRFGGSMTATLSVLISVSGVLLSLMSPVWVVILSLILISSGVFIANSATINYIAMNVTQGRSLASGIYYLCFYAGGAAGAFICGLAYEVGKWPYTVVALLMIQGMGMVVANTLMRKAA
ncbi:MFS transporter [Basilea psittacipulmonis]|uniref:MFS transporter n=1 Tax=Basilea psittacipulmonis DSM 24701 TaxID=1072685 RepID=A0A077DIP9_9BURK|nr:MFS transporter [Basilea psittacipulmonis]AIL33342.1 MFS transporter [Basilea psittacipulmonis DSM 24701]